MTGWSLAVDFGISFTSSAVSADGRIEMVTIDGANAMPSAVCVDEGGRLLVGREASIEAAANPARAERMPQRAMARAEYVRLGGHSIATVDLVAAVLAEVRAGVRHLSDRALERVVLTHPARWEPDGVELRRLVRAAEIAGFREPDLVAEPVAAACHGARGTGMVGLDAMVGVYDLGGITCDTAVVRRGRTGFELAGAAGGDLDLGGNDLDAELMEVLARHAQAIDPDRWRELWETPGPEADRRRAELCRDVTAAKESLSTQVTCTITVPGFDDRIRVTRGEFERAIDGVLERSVVETHDTVRRVGAAPESLAALYLVGGSSRTPRVSMLHAAKLPRMPIIPGDPQAAVAMGALFATEESATSPGRTVVLPGRVPGTRHEVSLTGIAAELAAIASDVGLSGATSAVLDAAPLTWPTLRRALDELAHGLGVKYTPFPGLPPRTALQVLREGRAELDEPLGRSIDRFDRVAITIASQR